MFIYGLLLKVSIVSTILFIWFQTNFVFYYYNLITNKILNVPEHLTYPEYLYERYRESNRLYRFVGKLQSCDKCLGLMLSIIICLNIEAVIVYTLSILLYNSMRLLASR